MNAVSIIWLPAVRIVNSNLIDILSPLGCRVNFFHNDAREYFSVYVSALHEQASVQYQENVFNEPIAHFCIYQRSLERRVRHYRINYH